MRRSLLFTTLSLLAAAASAQSNNELDCAAAVAAASESPAIIVATLADVPAIVRVPAKASRPPILLWHGFGPPADERALMAALPLDEVPAIKVYLGLPMFGARTLAGGREELGRRQREDLASRVFEPIVMGAAKELPRVVAALERQRCMKRGEAIGLFGFSAGGAAVLYALAERDVSIGAAVTLNASTGLSASVEAFERATKGSYTWNEAARRLARRSDAVARARDIVAGDPPPALSIIHGANDATMRPEIAIRLQQALLPLYEQANASERLQLRVVPGMAHVWTDTNDLETLRSSIAAWFHTYL